MDLKHIVLLAIQVSIVSMVFSFGLKTQADDLLYLVRRPGLLARCLLAIFVCMPVVAVALARTFDFRPTAEIALLALSISPLPPLLAFRVEKVVDTRFTIGLMATLATLSIVLVPAALALLEGVFDRHLSVTSGTVARVMLVTVLAPLAAGVIVRALSPALAARLEKPVAAIAMSLLVIGVLSLLVTTLPAMWALIGQGTLIAYAVFNVIGLLIGHVLGGPEHDESVVLALATVARHPMLALTIISANFTDQHFVAALVLYLLVNLIVGVPYLAWQRGLAARARA